MRSRLREAGALLGLQWRLDHHDPRQPWLSCRQFQRSCLCDASGLWIRFKRHPASDPYPAGGDVTCGILDTGLATVCWGKGMNGVRLLGASDAAIGGCLHRHGQPGDGHLSVSVGEQHACSVVRVIRVLLGSGGLRRAWGRGPNLLTPESGRGPDRMRHPHGGRRRDRRQLRRSQAISL